ncbi:RVT_3 domain-containing protein [Cephalotus follicularis]|uniref:RVT_3 domain-containing protein n=1 Tax=Cephalotus follicularis TaxID=3775 RepID=A0A1Q3ALW9_CEPFO|nr:RVT_3 domain-containing protein [Cephalotus follicularis]
MAAPPPPVGSLKLNTDGSCINNACAGGGVVWDHSGMIILAFSSYFGTGNSAEAEAKAMLLGLLLCSERGLPISFMELASLLIINCFNDLWDPPWAIEYILRESKILIPYSASISHVFRKGNGLADRLATHGHSSQGIATFDQYSLPVSCYPAFKADFLGQLQYRPP